MTRSSFLKPALILAICLLPVLLSSGLYYLRVARGVDSYGQLLPTRPLPIAGIDGWPRSQWVLASFDDGPCDAACHHRLFVQKQLRTGQGEDSARMAQVRVRLDGVPEPLSGVVSLSTRAEGAQLAQGGYYLIDPHGNQVLYYPDSADPIRVMRELKKVLKTNNGI